jgi:hypothetical protein
MPSGDEVAVLQTPTDTALGLEIVRRFFRAVVEESPGDLDSVLADDARASLNGNDLLPASSSWRARLARLDYQSLDNHVIYRPSEIETYRQVGAAPPLRHAGPLPRTITGNQLLLRVPIVAPRSGPTRLFGDEMWFLLKPGPNGYRIAELIENFNLP